MRMTNKKLLEHKDDRYEVYSFWNNGGRALAYGNLTIIGAVEEMKRCTQRGLDVLIVDYKEDVSVKVCTDLESGLGRRATKREIIDFYETKVKEEVK